MAFIAFTDAGTVYKSNDGVTWAAGASLPAAATGAFFGAFQLGVFLVFDVGTDTIYKSLDGDSWTTHAVGGTAIGITSCAATSTYHGVMSTASYKFRTSTDGETWTDPGSDSWPVDPMRSVAASSTEFCASNTYEVYTSPTGATWTSQTITWTTTPDETRMAHNGNVFVILGESSATALQYSADGDSWTEVLLGGTDFFAYSKQAFINHGTLFCCLGDRGSRGVLTSSNDGVSWTFTAVGTSTNARYIASDGVNAVIVGGSTTTYTSADGVTWTTNASALPAAVWSGVMGGVAASPSAFWTDFVYSTETYS